MLSDWRSFVSVRSMQWLNFTRTIASVGIYRTHLVIKPLRDICFLSTIERSTKIGGWIVLRSLEANICQWSRIVVNIRWRYSSILNMRNTPNADGCRINLVTWYAVHPHWCGLRFHLFARSVRMLRYARSVPHMYTTNYIESAARRGKNNRKSNEWYIATEYRISLWTVCDSTQAGPLMRYCFTAYA